MYRIRNNNCLPIASTWVRPRVLFKHLFNICLVYSLLYNLLVYCGVCVFVLFVCLDCLCSVSSVQCCMYLWIANSMNFTFGFI